MEIKESMMTAQQNIRARGDSNCPFHPEQKVILKCETCRGLSLVCPQCITSLHYEHKFTALEDDIDSKVDLIKEFVTTSETMTIPQLTQEISSITQKITETNESFVKERTAAEDHTAHMKEMMDRHLSIETSKLESRKQEILKSLEDYKKHLENHKKELEIQVVTSKPAIQSNSSILVLDTEAEIVCMKEVVPLSLQDISLPQFEPCKNPERHIQKAFGQFSPWETNLTLAKHTSRNEAVVVTSTTKTSSSSQNADMIADQLRTRYALSEDERILDQPFKTSEFVSKMSSFHSKISLYPVPHTSLAWIHGSKGKEIELYNDKGEVQKTLRPYTITSLMKTKISLTIDKLFIHPTTGDMYCCFEEDNDNIRHVNTETGESMAIFKVEPRSTFTTGSNDYVIMSKQLQYEQKNFGYTFIKYTTSLYVYSFTRKCVVHSTKLGVRISNMSACIHTNRIVLACNERGVKVLDGKLQEIFTFNGRGIVGSLERDNIITACAVFDEDGYLLVSDYKNKVIHVFNRALQHIKILKSKEMPVGEHSCFRANRGVLWWQENPHSGKVVCIKYKKKIDS